MLSWHCALYDSGGEETKRKTKEPMNGQHKRGSTTIRSLGILEGSGHKIRRLESIGPDIAWSTGLDRTERFTVAMVDMGLQGRGPAYLQWMVTNVSINALPNLHIRPNDELASYQQPVFLHGVGQSHLIQILVFRHYKTLRVPFGELWTTNRRNFVLSTLYSNTNPNLRLCGPVAATQYWVFDDKYQISPGAPQTPSAPQLPAAPLPPQQPQSQNPSPIHLYPVIPVVPVTHFDQSGNVPSPGQPGLNYPVHHPVTSFPKKSSSTIVHPLKLLLVSIVILIVVHRDLIIE